MSTPKPYHTSNKDDWETPCDLFNLLDREFDFELDVCANATNHKCPVYYNKEHDGLSMSWNTRSRACWMNPPYSQAKLWIAKAAKEASATCRVVCLLAARTDTKIWQEVIFPLASNIRFLKGRVRFVGAKAGAPFPSAVVVFGGMMPIYPIIQGWDWKWQVQLKGIRNDKS